MTEAKNKPLILTGAKPSGEMTLGNLLGALKNWAAMQDSHECLFPVVDMHAITVPSPPAELRTRTQSFVAQYIASGLDPEKSSIFIQSHVTGHAELCWVLSCLAPVGELHRMTQFKEKSSKPGASVNAGLLFYPVLMAADILLYNADLVPVGEDQKQHLELTRNIAQKFNATYSPTFTLPEPYIAKTGARIMSLQQPDKKMSKSDDDPNGCILLLDTPDMVRRKIMSAVTDSGSEIRMGPDKPGVSNLLTIMSTVTDRPIPALEAEFAGRGYGQFKAAVADAVIARLDPVRSKHEELMRNKDHLQAVLKSGAEAAQAKAFRMLAKVYRKIGFVERAR